MSGSKTLLHQEFPADIKLLDEIAQSLLIHAESQGFKTQEINHMQVALEEAFVNIASYAYKDKLGKVQITFSMEEPDSFVIEICDQGKPYNPLAEAVEAAPVTEDSIDIEALQPGGFGIFFMKRMMSDVSYQYLKGSNILRLVKKKSAFSG